MNTLDCISLSCGGRSTEVTLHYRTPQHKIKSYTYTPNRKQLNRLEDFMNKNRGDMGLNEIELGVGWTTIDFDI
jgi:hypothetical protein